MPSRYSDLLPFHQLFAITKFYLLVGGGGGEWGGEWKREKGVIESGVNLVKLVKFSDLFPKIVCTSRSMLM